MEKDEAALEKRLYELIASKRLLLTSKGMVWFHFTTIEDRIVSRNLYDIKLAQCKAQDIPTSEEMLELYIQQGLWDEAKDKNIEVLPSMIEEVQDRLVGEKNRVKRQKLERWLDSLNIRYTELLQDRNTRVANSAEFIAHDHSTLYLVWASVHDLHGNRLWETFDDMQTDHESVDYINELVELYLFNMGDMDESEIRYLARSTVWRVRWSTYQNSASELFGRVAKNLSNDQFMLIYWSQVYDSVYESFERPPEDIINNDEALDRWLLQENEKRKREIGQRFYGKSDTKENSKINNASEVFKVVTGEYDDDGVYRPYTPEERHEKVEKIKNLNSPRARAIKAAEEEKLRNSPGVFIQEHELRKGKTRREAMGGTVTYKGNDPRKRK